MSIESDAQKDLALSDDDAEGIAGGKKAKKATKIAAKPASHSVVYTYSPGLPAGVAPSVSEDLDDCDGPGYGGAPDAGSSI